MKKTLKEIIAITMSVIVATQPMLAATTNYTHKKYIKDLRITGSSTNPDETPVDPNNPTDTSGLLTSVDTLNFNPLEVGTETSLQVEVTNQGSATPLNIQTGVAVFAATHNCPNTLATGQSCIISVRFAPNSGANYSEFLSIKPLTGTAKKVALSGQGLGAVLSVNPKKLTFDDTFVGSDQIKALTVTNTGNKSATMGSSSFEGSTYSVIDNYCVSVLDIGQSCNLSVKFTPVSSGTSEDTLSLNANTGAGNTRATIALLGSGIESGLNVPKTVDFESVELGTTTVKSLSISNRGVNALNISAITFSDPDFSATGCTGSIAPGTTCRLPVEFSPTKLIAYDVTMTVVESQKSYTSSFIAVGTQTAVATATPDTLEFGNVTVGTSTAGQTVTLKNTGNANLKYNRFTVSEGYLADTACSGYLAPGQSCDFNVYANAVKNGQMNKIFTIYTNVGPQIVQLKAQASGGATDLLLSAESLNFGSIDALTTGEAQTVLVKNISAIPTNIKSIIGYAAFPATTSCSQTLAPQEECAVSVTFTPQTAKFYGGSVVITTDTGASSISTQGAGIASQLTLSPEGVDFGNISGLTQIEPQVLSVRSKGGKAATISGISITNPAFTQTNNCVGTLEDAKNCYITVSVTPGTQGATSGQLTVQSDSLEPLAPVALSAANNTYVAQVSPALVDFGTVVASPTGFASYELTVTNTGVANMTLNGISPINEYVTLKSSNCTNIAPQAACTLTLGLAKSKPMTLNQTFRTSGPGANQEFTVKATVQGVSARWVKSGIDFGYVAVGSSSQQSVMLTNKGNVTANLSGIQLNSSAFTVDASSCVSVDPQKNCTVVLGFNPSASGTYTATVSGVTTANPMLWDGDQLVITGNSVLKQISASTNNLDVGLIKQGQTSSTQTVSFINDGDVPLANVSINSPLGINVTTNCPTSLSVGASCSANVTADSAILNKPEGPFTSSLSIRSTMATTSIIVSGYITQDLTIKSSTSATATLPVTLDFGRVDLGTQKALNFYITAKGSAGKLVASASISGGNAGEFTWTKVAKVIPTGLVESSCGAQITGSSFSGCTADSFTLGQSSTTASALSLSLNMAATTPTGPRSANLTLTYNDGTQEVLPITAVVPSLAKASLSTDKLEFSPTDANTTSQLTVRLTNTGLEPLVITSAPEISGASTFSFPVGGGTTCSGSIAVGAYCDTTVNFKPTDNTSSSANLIFATSDYTSPAIVSLSGTGLQGIGSITVQGGGSSSFGGVTLGTTAKKVFMFNNTGNKAVTEVYPVLTSAHASVTMVNDESTCGTAAAKVSVGGGANCLITISYNASTQGEVLTGITLTVNSTAKNNPVSTDIQGFANGTLAVNVTNTSDVAVSTYNFGAVNVGSNTTYIVKVKNAGTVPVSLTSAPSMVGNAAYTVSATTCGASLAVSASCTATVKFAPTAAPQVTSDLKVITNAGSFTVSFQGTGIAPTASFNAVSNYDFGTVYVSLTATKSFTLTNTGGMSLTNLTSAITDSSVTIQSTTCGTSIAAAASCTVVLKYAPTAVGAIAANAVKFKLTAFTAGDVTVTPTSNITGTAVTATGSLTGPAGDYGTVYIGKNATLTYSFKATGTAALTNVYAGMRSGSNGYYAITTNTCGTSASPITLASNATCSVTVRYAPGAAGTHAGTLDLISSATNNPSSVSLTGTSMQDKTITVNGLTFGIASTTAANAANSFPLCDGTVLGQTGWRLPTLTELKTVGPYINSQGGTAYMDSKGWPWSGTLMYWTGTPYNVQATAYYAIVLPGTLGEARGVGQSAVTVCVK